MIVDYVNSQSATNYILHVDSIALFVLLKILNNRHVNIIHGRAAIVEKFFTHS